MIGQHTAEGALLRTGLRAEASNANGEQPSAGGPQAPPQTPTHDTLTAHIHSTGREQARVFAHPTRAEMAPANLHVGDEVVLDIQGAVARGIVSGDEANVCLRTLDLPSE